MTNLTQAEIQGYRASIYRTLPGQSIKNYDEALKFIETRGFIFFWPIRDIEMPSLWVAVAGDRPVADEHDDPGHITWGWKDEMVRSKACYYAKILRGKSTMVAWEYLPYFYALSENFGDPESDHLERYRSGRLAYEAKVIYEALLDNGPLDTIELRKKVHMTSETSENRFAKAIYDLQKSFLIAPVEITTSGGWRYAFAYDIPARYLPSLIDQTRQISDSEARHALLMCYLKSVGACRFNDISKIFGWTKSQAEQAIHQGLDKQLPVVNGETYSLDGEWILHDHLADFLNIVPGTKRK